MVMTNPSSDRAVDAMTLAGGETSTRRLNKPSRAQHRETLNWSRARSTSREERGCRMKSKNGNYLKMAAIIKEEIKTLHFACVQITTPTFRFVY